MRDEMSATLRIYKWPSQAFWRHLEVRALRQIEYEHPILEIGCGDGQLSSLIFRKIDEAIDINPRSVEKCRCLAGHLYRDVRCQDARDLQFSGAEYGTIYANCVMEHIPDIQAVLAGCSRALRPGGKLVMTVPLVEMNKHLLFPWGWYVGMRQHQLVHVNLLTRQRWEYLLCAAGFSTVEFQPYLSGKACKFWDTLDSLGCIGFGRYRLAPAAGLMAHKLLPTSAKAWLLRRIASWLTARVNPEVIEEPACATVTIATKA